MEGLKTAHVGFIWVSDLEDAHDFTHFSSHALQRRSASELLPKSMKGPYVYMYYTYLRPTGPFFLGLLAFFLIWMGGQQSETKEGGRRDDVHSMASGRSIIVTRPNWIGK